MYPAMEGFLPNWRVQVRKGYLELCILTLIKTRGKLHGFDMLSELSVAGIDVKEGTLYPLLNRMSAEDVLEGQWDTASTKGHPRKYYRLTSDGQKLLKEMAKEFASMTNQLKNIGHSMN